MRPSLVPQAAAEEAAAGMRSDRERIADELGLPARRVTDALLLEIAEDPLLLHHLELCRTDPDMLDLLLGDAGHPGAAPAPDASPGAAELVGRAGAALARWAASGFQRASKDTYRRRLSACWSCEHLSAPPGQSLIYRLAGTSRQQRSICGLCGCDVRRKAWLATEDCPDGRWEAGAE